MAAHEDSESTSSDLPLSVVLGLSRSLVSSDSADSLAARTTPVAPGQAGWRGAAATAGSYVPNSVSATATSVADRAKDGFDSVFTQERKGQVSRQRSLCSALVV